MLVNPYLLSECKCVNETLLGGFQCSLILVTATIGPVLIMWFNYCVLSFASEITNLLIAFASHEAHKARYK